MIRRILFLSLLLLLSTYTNATNYKIVRLVGTSSITIGDEQLSVGDLFDDHEIIHWTSQEQAIKAIAVEGENSGRTVTISARSCESKRVKSLYRYANMVSRAIEEDEDIFILFEGEKAEIYSSDRDSCSFYLLCSDNEYELTHYDNHLYIEWNTIKSSGMYEVWLMKKCHDSEEPVKHFMIDIIK